MPQPQRSREFAATNAHRGLGALRKLHAHGRAAMRRVWKQATRRASSKKSALRSDFRPSWPKNASTSAKPGIHGDKRAQRTRMLSETFMRANAPSLETGQSAMAGTLLPRRGRADFGRKPSGFQAFRKAGFQISSRGLCRARPDRIHPRRFWQEALRLEKKPLPKSALRLNPQPDMRRKPAIRPLTRWSPRCGRATRGAGSRGRRPA